MLDGRQPDSQEDRRTQDFPLQFHCSEAAKVVADHFARTTVRTALCDSGRALGEFWSEECTAMQLDPSARVCMCSAWIRKCE